MPNETQCFTLLRERAGDFDLRITRDSTLNAPAYSTVLIVRGIAHYAHGETSAMALTNAIMKAGLHRPAPPKNSVSI